MEGSCAHLAQAAHAPTRAPVALCSRRGPWQVGKEACRTSSFLRELSLFPSLLALSYTSSGAKATIQLPKDALDPAHPPPHDDNPRT